ncbi:MAG: hypothetical protein HYS17_07390 [Micavibrio aeruginosavorus]|uniref:Alpha/beta hydrolase n=1 Tax=Micavibrio aeruginosavorus TaxID=349221 RepID=A0A7T5R0N5_9BACT|nr:MAG: hypothetical protein HYS17_07390 [Micavibrio aeruginosavorus]
MRVHWTVFQDGDAHVEGQIFEPEQPTDQVVLFCPGYPGLGALHFEQRHVATLTQEGYAVVVLRHCGTRLDSPPAPAMVNNGARLRHGREHGQTYIGGAPSTVGYWLNEPLIAMKTLANVYEHIHVFGNSFGALSSLWSMTTEGVPLDKVRCLILVAGAQGVITDDPQTDIMRIWKTEYMTAPRITDKVAFLSVEEDIKTLREVYEQLPERTKNLPSHIQMSYIVVAQDEILSPGDAERFRAAIGGRGQVIIDDLDKPYYDYNLMAHDMPDYPTEHFLALLRE